MEIVIREGIWLSQGDENAFFERLYGLSCVGPISRELGGFVHIKLKRRPTTTQLKEIIALLFRYDMDMTSLAALRTPLNARWFDDPIKFWHESVFDKRPSRGKKIPK